MAHLWISLVRERSELAAQVVSFSVLDSHHFTVFFTVGTGLPSMEVVADRLDMRVPTWVAFALFGVYPTAASIGGLLSTWRRWHRHRNGWCIGCGYNLTGNISGACPECGTRAEKP